MANRDPQSFVLVVVGDEILSGKREDKHLSHVIETLTSRNMPLHSVHYVGDELEALIRHLMLSREFKLIKKGLKKICAPNLQILVNI